MSHKQRQYGPSHAIETTNSFYAANPEDINKEKSLGNIVYNTGKPKAILLSSPLIQGTREHNYRHNLLYPTQRGWDSSWPTDTRSSGSTLSNGLTPYHSDYKYRTDWYEGEMRVSGESYAANSIFFRFGTYEGQRPSSAHHTREIANALNHSINSKDSGKGLFGQLIPGAHHGFAIAKIRDFDEVATNGDGTNAGDFNIGSYWRESNRLQPLNHLYNNYYSTSDPKSILASSYKLDASGNLKKHISVVDLSKDNDPYVITTGPFGNTTLKLGNGNNVIAPSPVMTPAIYNLLKYDGTKTFVDEVDNLFFSNTILYPSSVGPYLTNTLELGGGNNVIYYDSSFKKITTGPKAERPQSNQDKHQNVFLPSFGSFNWSADWLHAEAADTYYNPSLDKLGYKYTITPNDQKPLIAPIPWDLEPYKPKYSGLESPFLIDYDKSNNPINSSYVKRSAIAANKDFSKKDYVVNKGNLYTVNFQTADPNRDPVYNKNFFNGKTLDGEKLYSYNPVNRMGGITLKAEGGDNMFYGMDWRLWESLLPKAGITSANQVANENQQIVRAAVNAWSTVNIFGGPGSNSFWLGNVIDDITNNGNYYRGQNSYLLSLTHDKVYSIADLNNPKFSRFDKLLRGDDNRPLESSIHLSLQADPTTIEIITQRADPGVSSNPVQQAGAWNGLANAVNKAQGNGEKAITSYADWIKKGTTKVPLLKLAQIASKAVPWVDFAASAVSATVGLFNLATAPATRPPKQEIKATYIEQALDLAKKAVRVNDWHPSTHINFNIPATNKGAWASLSLEIVGPTSNGSDNTSLGTHIQLKKSYTIDGINSDVKSPLVVLDHLDVPAAKFGYYSYNFINKGLNAAAPNNTERQPDKIFTKIGKDHLRFFGTLPNPSGLAKKAGSDKPPVLIPGEYEYKSVDGFDMRNDAANYPAFTDSDPENFYTRYYWGDKSNIITSQNPDAFPTGWDEAGDVWSYSPVITMEFDSRSLGWYWMPVMKPANTSIGESSPSVDFDQSKLWIRGLPRDPWRSYAFSDLDNRVEAYRYSLMANTFYYLEGGEESQRQEVIAKSKLYDSLYALEKIMPDLDLLNQSGIRNPDKQLILLQQITGVKKVVASDENVISTSDVFKVTFDYVDNERKELSTSILIFKDEQGQLKALSSNLQEREFDAKLNKLASIIGENTRYLHLADNWPGRGTLDEAPSLEKVSEVRDVEFDVNGKIGEHRIIYSKGTDPQEYRSVISRPLPWNQNYWHQYYEGKVDVALSITNSLSVETQKQSVKSVQLAVTKDLDAASNQENNTINGNQDNNQLLGNAGQDEIWGRQGTVPMIGRRGRDLFVFRAEEGAAFSATNQGLDRIIDFQNRRDKIGLDQSSFSLPLSKGESASSEWFATVSRANQVADSNAVIVYAEREQKLFFNANGDDKGFGVGGGAFAMLTGDVSIGIDDLMII